MTVDGLEPAVAHEYVVNAIKQDVTTGGHKAVVVDSPPGAGKSTFVVDVAADLRESATIPIVAQTNAQADDLVRKLRTNHPDLTVGRLYGSTYPELEEGPELLVSKNVDDLHACNVIVATGAKWGYVDAVKYPVGIIDEAYQMRSDQLLYVADLFDRGLFVGDPGQLDPFTPADDSRWRGQPDGPVSPAVATVLHNHPDSPVHRLPVSWRLSSNCAPLVSESFYPAMPFRAGSNPTERALAAGVDADGSGVDEAIDVALDRGWAYLELPHAVVPTTDTEAIEALVQSAIRCMQRQIEATDSPGDDGRVAGSRIAVGVVHRDQRAVAQTALDRAGEEQGIDVSQITVDTANRLQGREYHIVLVLHPLSGRAAASEFHLETGRLCVLMSRHRHACIVVSRAGVAELLDDHPMSAPIWIGAPIPVPDGWEANQAVIDALNEYRVATG